ncbi:MAG: DUF2905 domain-containing protein [Firmicutes bacterium]|nr:DUF2905 domain-containing protein [Bacillota bacterium]
MSEFGRMLVTIGLLLVGVGLVVMLVGRIPGLGRLPGDILIRRGNFTFYAPIATMLLLSLVLTLLLNLFRR